MTLVPKHPVVPARPADATRSDFPMLRTLKASSSYRVLEQRMVFDGAAAGTVAEAAAPQDQAEHTDTTAHGLPDAAATEHAAPQSDPSSADLMAALATAPTEPLAGARTIVFIDSQVADAATIAASVPSGAEVVYLDADRDGVEQIADVLDGRTGIDAIHIVSHGSEGRLNLGSAVLTAASMQNAHLDELTAIGAALGADGDILIYGCDFTAGEAGLEAAMVLGGITGADIAASADATGHADFGGDWDLETNVGDIGATSIDASQWHNLLGTSTATHDWATSATLTQGGTVNYALGGIANAMSITASGTGAITGNMTGLGDGGTGDVVMRFRGNTTSTTSGETIDIQFNASALPDGVKTVAFNIGNIDSGTWDDRVIVQAYDKNGTLLSGSNITATPLSTVNQTYTLTANANSKQMDGNIDGPSDSDPGDTIRISVASTTGANVARVTILYVSGTSGTTTGALGLGDITITYDSAPVLDLNASTAGTGHATTFTEGGAAVAIANTNSLVTDTDDANMASATVVLTNTQVGDQLLVGGTPVANGSTGTINGISYTVTEAAGQTSIALSGSATKAVYADTIEAISFRNTSDTPSTTPRTINVTVSDGEVTSNTAVTTINVTAVLETVVDLNSTYSAGVVSTPVTSNLVANGTFADNSATPASWTESSNIGTGANGRYIWTSSTDSITQALTVPAGSTTIVEFHRRRRAHDDANSCCKWWHHSHLFRHGLAECRYERCKRQLSRRLIQRHGLCPLHHGLQCCGNERYLDLYRSGRRFRISRNGGGRRRRGDQRHDGDYGQSAVCDHDFRQPCISIYRRAIRCR